jgi:hypothetical protein
LVDAQNFGNCTEFDLENLAFITNCNLFNYFLKQKTDWQRLSRFKASCHGSDFWIVPRQLICSVVKYCPWRISGAGFWLFTTANFVKDGGVTALYLDMAAPRVGRYGGFLALCHLPSTTLLMWTVDFRNCIMLLWNSFKSQERAVDFRNCIMPSTGTSKWNGSQYNRMHHTATISLFGAKYKLILFYYDYNLHCISHNTCNRNDFIHNHNGNSNLEPWFRFRLYI